MHLLEVAYSPGYSQPRFAMLHCGPSVSIPNARKEVIALDS
jgi:hypothetical protein